jgi:hypothetical protein
MNPRPLIYVAGPLTADTPEERALNVARAIDVAEQLYKLGWAPVVPHTQGEAWQARHPHHYEEWMELCRAWLRPCQALFRMAGGSPGAKREEVWAHELYIPVLFTMETAAKQIEALEVAA